MTRAPRLPIAGEERERVLGIIREGIRTLPAGGANSGTYRLMSDYARKFTTPLR